MSCCTATTATVPSIGTPDPGQHVNFVKGMVLGVADYVQEHAYLAGRSEWMARDLIGYGTASGLAIRTETDGTNGPRVHISAGSAVAPSGKMICVGREQCGSINGWLGSKENGAAVAARISGSPPVAQVTLYLTLCYRDCAIAPIPVPGEPCRSDEELMQPSRIADDYCLDFRLDPPEQWEADAIATFAAWLDAVADDGPASPPLAPDQWANEIRAALGAITGDFLDGSPPVGSPPLAPPLPPGVSTDDYNEFLRLAYRLWITEYRPKVMAQRCGEGAARANDCVLLAALDVPLVHTGSNPETGWSVGAAGDLRVDEGRRPLIAPLHLVQTALGIMTEGGSSTTIWGSPPTSPPGGWPTSPPGGWPTPPAGRDGTNGTNGTNGRDADELPFRLKTIATAGSIRLDDKIDCVIAVDDLKIELPSVREAGNGRSYYIKALAETSITPQPEEILELLFTLPDRQRQTDLVLRGRQSVQLVCDAENGRWLIIGDFQPQRGG